jgi:TatA/E family protein of Tat protein translocase
MFGSLGGPELILILVIALIVFGPRRLPDIGKSVGKMLVEFRRASNDFKRTIEDEVESEKRALNAQPGSVRITPGSDPVVGTMGLNIEGPEAAASAAIAQADEARPQPVGTVAQASATPSDPA